MNENFIPRFRKSSTYLFLYYLIQKTKNGIKAPVMLSRRYQFFSFNHYVVTGYTLYKRYYRVINNKPSAFPYILFRVRHLRSRL